MQVSKSELKRKMLAYFREVERTGEPIIVTDHGRPVLEVVPIRSARTVEEVFGPWRGEVVYREDVTLPTSDEWPER
jgi:prevent-host-death family protein